MHTSSLLLRLGALGAFGASIGIAALLMQMGVSPGVSVTTGMLLVGVTLVLSGRALTGSNVESRLSVLGLAMLLITSLVMINLGKETWPQANAFLLFSGGVALIALLLVIGGRLVDALVGRSRSPAAVAPAPGTTPPQSEPSR